MYPLTAWTYEQLCERMHLLRAHALHPELVVVTSQLIEQVIKRHLARECNTQRRYWNRAQRQWVTLTTPAQRDQWLQTLQGPEDWKPAWRKLLYQQRGLPPLDRALDQVVGPQTWTILIKTGTLPLLPGQPPGDQPLRYGLRRCRHALVHGMQSPPRREMELLGTWGAYVVERILDPVAGWPWLLGWGAQARLPALRIRWPGPKIPLSPALPREGGGSKK